MYKKIIYTWNIMDIEETIACAAALKSLKSPRLFVLEQVSLVPW